MLVKLKHIPLVLAPLFHLKYIAWTWPPCCTNLLLQLLPHLAASPINLPKICVIVNFIG